MSSPNKDNSFRFSIDEAEATLEHPIFMGAKLKVPTEKLAARYFNTTKKDSGLLPPVVRYTSPDFSSFIVERPPTVVRIEFKPAPAWKTEHASETYYIPLPWMVYALKFTSPDLNILEDLYIFGRNEPIFSEDDPLYLTPIPNLYRTGLVCQGHAEFNELLKEFPTSDTNTKINAIINRFWSSGFNMDLDKWINYAIPEYFELNGCEDPYNPTVVLKWWSQREPAEMLEVAYKSPKEDDAGKLFLTLKDVIAYLSTSQEITQIGGGRPLLLYFRSLAMAAIND